jgi:hypothetical protein
MVSVGSVWLVKAVPAHIWPDLARGVFLRTGQVSSNTDAATWTSYLFQSENEVAYLVACRSQAMPWGTWAIFSPIEFATAQPDHNILR